MRYNPGRFKSTHGEFIPKGPMRRRRGKNRRGNPVAWSSEKTQAARFFVGFNVDDVATYELKDLIDLVEDHQKAYGKEGASFVAQKGIYKHKKEPKIVDEDSAQLIIVDVWDTPPKRFEDEMVELAEEIAKNMDQEEVILEIQDNGVTREVFGVTA